jgi:hypothetical protein
MGLAFALAALTSMTAALARDELVAMDLPTVGPVAAPAQACYDSLQRLGYDVWWLRQHNPRQADRQPVVLLFNTAAPLRATQAQALPDFLRHGGGLVLVADSARDSLSANRALLEPLGVRVYPGTENTAAVQLRAHEITADVADPGQVLGDLTFSASKLEILATQGIRPVAVAGTLGQGRFVVLLDNLVSTMAGVGADSPQARLLTQAVRWATAPSGAAPSAAGQSAASQSAASPSVPPEPQPEPFRGEPLTGQALVDLGGTTGRWPDIRRTVEALLDAAGLKRTALSYVKDKATLVQGLAAGPALVVIGATRPYAEDEAGAFGQYIWNGGGALALAYTVPTTIPHLQALNRLLAEVGVAATFGRPAGVPVALPGPLTTGLTGWTQVPAGNAVWALEGDGLVTVGRNAVFATHEFGRGRVVVCDALTLVPDASVKPPAPDGSPPFRELASRALTWLIARPNPEP